MYHRTVLIRGSHAPGLLLLRSRKYCSVVSLSGIPRLATNNSSSHGSTQAGLTASCKHRPHRLMHLHVAHRSFFSKFISGANLNLKARRGDDSNLAFERQAAVKAALRAVLEPITQRNLVSIGAIQTIRIDTANVTSEAATPPAAAVTLVLDTFVPGYPYQPQLTALCTQAIRSLPWVSEASVEYAVTIPKPKPHQQPTTSATSNSTASAALANVKHIIAVSSCKGGVGKSTVAVNLAFALASSSSSSSSGSNSLKVGLLDADVYGPSLPSMVHPANLDTTVRRSKTDPKCIMPLTAPLGVQMLSFGHVNPQSGAPGAGGKSPALMRGPIATKVINQLLHMTEWGQLDYLVIDMPPGTGDIQITLAQSVPITGAVVVTTPHQLALVDCAKGVAMFQEVQVPTLAVVENMAFFTCRHGEVYYPFGRGGRDKVLKCLTDDRTGKVSNESKTDKTCEPGCDHSSHNSETQQPPSIVQSNLQSCAYHSFPLTAELACNDDSHVDNEGPTQFPVVLRDPTLPLSQQYFKLAEDVIGEVFKIQVGAQLIPWVGYIEGRGIVLRYFSASKAEEYYIPALELRIRDPKTGKVLPGESTDKYASTAVKPVRFEAKGNYGVAVIWSDGYFADIYSFDVLHEIATEFKEA